MSLLPQKTPSHSAILLIGIFLTLIAVVVHPLLPKRELTLPPVNGGNFFLLQSGDPKKEEVHWVDWKRFHFICRFAAGIDDPSCSFNYMLFKNSADKGIDLSRYRTLRLKLRYSGNAHYIRVSIRDFDPRFSRLGDGNSSKINSVNVHPQDFAQPVLIDLDEFTVPEWWLTQYDLSRNLAQRDMRNATALTIDLLGDHLDGQRHEFQIDQIEFTGDWISAENWYLGILCIWMVAATVYGLWQLLQLRREHRIQRRRISTLVEHNTELRYEKEKYRRLSTIDALTRVLNRHGIEQYIELQRQKSQAISIILIDLDHFKRINDQLGHHIGDRVLQTVGDILANETRDSDGLGRWGGEEFVLVCPNTPLPAAVELAEKLRCRIKETIFIPEAPLSVTASFGVAVRQVDQTFEDVFMQADNALYLAKNRGRNCVVAARDDQLHAMTGATKGTWALISGRFKLLK